MDPIPALRKRAEQKRDYAIHLARQIYQRDLAAIDALDRALPLQLAPEPEAMQDAQNTSGLILTLIPPGKPFTVADMLDWLHAAQPGQKFREQTIRTYIARLSGRGVIKRLYKNGRNYTRWIASESIDLVAEQEKKPLRDLVADILRAAGKTLLISEIAVALRDKGYRIDVKPTTINRAVSDSLRRHRKTMFERGVDGRWGLIQ